MITGQKEKFAIEAVVDERPEGWALGHFRFWIDGKEVGDWSDTVDLKGCVQWLLDFVSNPRDRYHPGLATRSAKEVFELVYDPVISEDLLSSKIDPPIKDAFSRFHITHLGMSSFEAFDVLLVKDEVGVERVLWRRAGESKIEECFLESDTLESIALVFCGEFQKELKS